MRKKEDKKIENNEEIDYKVLLDKTGDLISLLSLERNPKYLYVNNSHESTLSYKKDELIGKSPMDFIHPDNLPDLRKKLGNFFKEIAKSKSHKPVKSAYRFRKKDGSWIFLESTADFIMGRIFVVSRDVTKEKKYLESTEAERAKAEKYLNIAGSIIVAIDLKGTVTLINKTGCEMLGRNRDEIVGKNWFLNFIPKEEYRKIKMVQRETLSDMKKFEKFENHIVSKSGERKLIKWHNTLLQDENGLLLGTLSSGEDITDARKKEKIMIESAQEWSDTFDSMSDGVTVHDADFKIINANNEACKLLGRKKEEIIGQKCYSVFHNTDYPINICPLAKSKESKKREAIEYYDEHLKKWLSIIISPVFDNNKIFKYIHIARDISREKKEEEANNKRREDLERFNKLAIGRELKMIELKKEISELRKQLNID